MSAVQQRGSAISQLSALQRPWGCDGGGGRAVCLISVSEGEPPVSLAASLLTADFRHQGLVKGFPGNRGGERGEYSLGDV